MNVAGVPITAELLRKHDRPGPRYTSYPTAVEFHDGVGEAVYLEKLAQADAVAAEPLSFYFHLPFCHERCTFCGCHVTITKRTERATEYLSYLEREVDLVAQHLPHRRQVAQFHWGGGTPTYHSPEELRHLFQVGEFLGPRLVSQHNVRTYLRLMEGIRDSLREGRFAEYRLRMLSQLRSVLTQGPKGPEPREE